MNAGGGRVARVPWRARYGRVARALAVVAVAAAVAVGAAGCGARASLLNVGDVYARTVSARTARAAVDLHIGAPHSGTYITAQGNVDLTAPGFSITVQEAGINLRELLQGDRLFVEVPASARAANGGKAWAELALRAGTGASTGAPAVGSELDGSSLAGSVLSAVDPAPVLDLLKLAPTSTTRLGLRSLDGVSSTEYRLDYRAADLAAAPHGGTPAGVVSLLAQIAHPRPNELPGLRMARQPRPAGGPGSQRRHRDRALSPSPAQAALANRLPTTLSVSIYLGHFGEHLRLVAPAANRTNRVPLAELEGGTL